MKHPFSAAKNPAPLRVDSKYPLFSPRRQKLRDGFECDDNGIVANEIRTIMKKQSGALRLHLCVRRYADTPTRRYLIVCGCGSAAL
jgi:hypothetical protein